jgi:hypothetical protein
MVINLFQIPSTIGRLIFCGLMGLTLIAPTACSIDNGYHELYVDDCRACHLVFEADSDMSVDGGVDAGNETKDNDGRIMVGRHATVDCITCHSEADMIFIPNTQCVSCHEESRTETDIPNHEGAPDTCEMCHWPMGWTRILRWRSPVTIVTRRTMKKASRQITKKAANSAPFAIA